jgi:hypothetical protein
VPDLSVDFRLQGYEFFVRRTVAHVVPEMDKPAIPSDNKYLGGHGPSLRGRLPPVQHEDAGGWVRQTVNGNDSLGSNR